MTSPTLSAADRNLVLLLLAAIVTTLAWILPYASYLLYPFAILSTWFHEMGHGLMALAMGGELWQLRLNPDGSGVAGYTLGADAGVFAKALIAMSGPLGPPLAGMLFIVAGRSPGAARWTLLLLGGMLLLSGLLWVHSAFGLVAVAGLGLGMFWLALRSSVGIRAFAIQFLGVQACLSTWRQVGYLFKDYVTVEGNLMASDTMQIQQNLWLPYWLWGLLLALASIALLVIGLGLAYRPQLSPSSSRR